jgi:AraC-like DNA-binding protein
MPSARPAEARYRYEERRPPPALAGYFVCSWCQRIGPGETSHRQRVLPDACIDVVSIAGAAPVVVGPMARASWVALPPGSLTLGLRLQPGTAQALLGMPALELRDLQVPLAELAGPTFGPVSSPDGKACAVAPLALALARRTEGRNPTDPLARAALRWLAARPQGRVRDLARDLDVGERQLHRRLLASVGHGPKQLQRILRLQRALGLGRTCGLQPASVACDAGYADQAHMSREFQALAGGTPVQLLGACWGTAPMSDLFKTSSRGQG